MTDFFGYNRKNTGYGENLIPPTLPDFDEAHRKAYKEWLMAGRVANTRYLQYNSFSGADIKAAVYIPPAKAVEDPNDPQIGTDTGKFKVWAELQTLTVSSERPPGPVRTLGFANVRDYVRGVRTIAGSLIFTVFDRDVFADIYQKSPHESLSEYPLYVDEIPQFNIIVTATNEMGVSAGAAIMGVTLTNYGTTYSIDDLMLEATYTYVAKYVHPFMNPSNWRQELSKVVSQVQRRQIAISQAARRISRLENNIDRVGSQVDRLLGEFGYGGGE
jgi:hypothetical protein